MWEKANFAYVSQVNSKILLRVTGQKRPPPYSTSDLHGLRHRSHTVVGAIMQARAPPIIVIAHAVYSRPLIASTLKERQEFETMTSTSDLVIGGLCCLLSAVGFGSMFVPIKPYILRDGASIEWLRAYGGRPLRAMGAVLGDHVLRHAHLRHPWPPDVLRSRWFHEF